MSVERSILLYEISALTMAKGTVGLAGPVQGQGIGGGTGQFNSAVRRPGPYLTPNVQTSVKRAGCATIIYQRILLSKSYFPIHHFLRWARFFELAKGPDSTAGRI